MVSHHLRQAQVDEDLWVAEPEQDRNDAQLGEHCAKSREALHSIVKVLEQTEVGMARSMEDVKGCRAAWTEISVLE